MENKKISNWLLQKYLAWQSNDAQRRTITELSELLGVHQTTVSAWLSGDRTPGRANAARIAVIFGDEIYNLLGLVAPDMQQISNHWYRIPPEVRQQIKDMISPYIIKNEK